MVRLELQDAGSTSPRTAWLHVLIWGIDQNTFRDDSICMHMALRDIPRSTVTLCLRHSAVSNLPRRALDQLKLSPLISPPPEYPDRPVGCTTISKLALHHRLSLSRTLLSTIIPRWFLDALILDLNNTSSIPCHAHMRIMNMRSGEPFDY